MPYVGNQPTSVAFLTDTFNGNGSTTAFTLSAAPATSSSILVAVSGVLQDPSTYSTTGTTLNFSAAPPSGTGNISVRFLGIPASGVTTTAYRTQTEFTATAGQTTFSVPSYTVGYIDVYRNGVLLGSADFTATNGTTVVLTAGASAGDLVETVSFYVSSVLNAVPTTGGTFSGNVLFGSGNGIWNTSGDVGIGTTSPNNYANYKTLTINGTSGGVLDFDINETRTGTLFTDSTGVGLSSLAAKPLLFYTNSSERMRIDSSGNVLVNTTSTGADGLNISIGKNISFAEGSGVSYANMFRQSSSAALVLAMGYKYTATASGFASSVGTSIAKSAISLGTVAGGITFYADAAVTTANGTDVTPTERMRITSGGNLLVGTTSDISTGGTSVARACFDSGSGQNGMKVKLNNTSYAAYISTTTGSDHYFGYMNNSAGTNVGSILCTNTTTTYSTSSDYRLKENIQPMTGALSKVQALNPVTYTWKADGSSSQGFIAHELQAVVPECVTGEKDAVNEDGSIKPQGIDTSFLVATLTKAIQELNDKVEAQAAEIKALKGAIE